MSTNSASVLSIISSLLAFSKHGNAGSNPLEIQSYTMLQNHQAPSPNSEKNQTCYSGHGVGGGQPCSANNVSSQTEAQQVKFETVGSLRNQEID